MHYIRALVLTTALVTITAWCAEPAHGDDAGALIALEHRWVDALQKSDLETLSAILANTYVDTDETGHRGDKASVLSALKSRALKFSVITVSEMKPVIYGHAAVVTGTGVQQGTFDGQPLAQRVVFTDTFVRAGKTWKVVASQRTAAPK